MPWLIYGGQRRMSQLAGVDSLLASCGNQGSNADCILSPDGRYFQLLSNLQTPNQFFMFVSSLPACRRFLQMVLSSTYSSSQPRMTALNSHPVPSQLPLVFTPVCCPHPSLDSKSKILSVLKLLTRPNLESCDDFIPKLIPVYFLDLKFNSILLNTWFLFVQWRRVFTMQCWLHLNLLCRLAGLKFTEILLPLSQEYGN